MAKQRYINTKFWEDNYISKLNLSEKMLFLYLLTNSATNICGCYEIPIKRMNADTGISSENINSILKKLSKDNKVKYYDGWIAIKNFIKHQNQGSPKIQKGIEVEIKLAPIRLSDWLLKGIDTLSNNKTEGMDTVSHSNTNTNSNTNSNTNLDEAKASTPEHVGFVNKLVNIYKEITKEPYKPKVNDFTIAHKLIKAYGLASVTKKANVMFNFCEQKKFPCSSGFADLTIGNLSSNWQRFFEDNRKVLTKKEQMIKNFLERTS